MSDAPKTKGPGKKVGPLKTWQWGLVGVGTYGVYYLYKAHQSNTAAATTAAGSSPSTATTAGNGLADGNGSGVYYLNPTASTTTATTTAPAGTMTMTQFAEQIAFQLRHANKGNATNLADITKAVNQYLNGQPITNVTLANQISHITSYSNALGAKAINQGGLVKPVLFATNVVTSAHTPSESDHRASTAIVAQEHPTVVQPTRSTTVARATGGSRSTVKPKTTESVSNPILPFTPGYGVTKPGVAGTPLLPFTPGYGVVPGVKLNEKAPKPKQPGFIPAIDFSGFGANPVRDGGVIIRNAAVGAADVTKVAVQGVAKSVGSFFSGLGL